MPHTAPAFHQLNLFLIHFHDPAVGIGIALVADHKTIGEGPIWKSFPIPAIGLPCGTIYLKSRMSQKISSSLIGFGYFFSIRASSFAIR